MKNKCKSRCYWKSKIKRNIERDRGVNAKLEEQGWLVLRFWEKEIRKETGRCVDTIICAIKERCTE